MLTGMAMTFSHIHTYTYVCVCAHSGMLSEQPRAASVCPVVADLQLYLCIWNEARVCPMYQHTQHTQTHNGVPLHATWGCASVHGQVWDTRRHVVGLVVQ